LPNSNPAVAGQLHNAAQQRGDVRLRKVEPKRKRRAVWFLQERWRLLRELRGTLGRGGYDCFDLATLALRSAPASSSTRQPTRRDRHARLDGAGQDAPRATPLRRANVGAVIELCRGLSEGELRALAELERRVLEVDGGRLKLEWGVLRSRGGEIVEDLLWWDGDRLTGFLGLYAFGEPTVEIAGMVDPPARRRGIGTELLATALATCRARGHERALLVTPRGSVAGRAFALSRGAVLEHSEHALVLVGAPADGPADARTTVRTATLADVSELTRLLDAAFDGPSADVAARLAERESRTLVVERGGAAVGTLRITYDRDTCGIYGFAVDPAWQGRGIGRDVLRRVCRELAAEGIRRIGLEVAVENDHALRLYSSLGFIKTTTEDYYELTLG